MKKYLALLCSILILGLSGCASGEDNITNVISDSKLEQYHIESDLNEYPVPEAGNGLLILIDAGHQAHANIDKEPVGPGASEEKIKVSSGTQGVYTGVEEFELNLAVALKLQTELEKRGYDVIMTRTSNNVDISNIERAEMANESAADAFIRIHANYSDSNLTSGVLTVCQTETNPYNAILYTECRCLSQLIVDEICAQTGSNNLGVLETDTMSGINWSKVPVTIVEMGFMSNEEEDYAMQTDEYQYKIVEGIANGLDSFFEQN